MIERSEIYCSTINVETVSLTLIWESLRHLSVVEPDGVHRLTCRYPIAKLVLLKCHTFKMSYFNRIVNLWNFILNVAPPDTFLTISSFRTFLHKIYKDLLSKIFDPDLTCTYSLYRTCSCHSLYIFNLT